jgi:myo-inositol-1(or 4)-monophosphatase
MNLQNYLEIAKVAAYAGGVVLRKYWGKLQQIEEKQPGDLVTIADRESEAVVLEIIRRHFPEHSILAEESGEINIGNSQFLWAIDPLDGTTNFAHQYPFSGVSIALLIDGIPAVGVIYDPFHDELFSAATGLGAFCSHRGDLTSIHVSQTKVLERSLLVTGFAYDRTKTEDNNYAEFCHFTHITQGVRRGGAASVDLAYIACGRLDGYWERGLSLWDIAAGIVIVREAGGLVTAYDGSGIDLKSGRILACNPHLHPQIVAELKNVKPFSPNAWKNN